MESNTNRLYFDVMTNYKLRSCKKCDKQFQPTARNQPYCSVQCRFWVWVDIRSEAECWPWLGQTDSNGYGRIRVGGRNQKTNRIAYQLAHGDIPAGGHICHTCDNPICVNPDHLWIGTHAENMKDMARKGRRPRVGSKLTEAQAIEIYRDNRPERQIASDFNISHSIVNDIKNRRKWRTTTAGL